MEGMIKVSYSVMCENDITQDITLAEILSNEKIEKAIKSEFAKGLRNIVISSNSEATITLKTQREIYQFEVTKDDFADILVLAEEDARKHKRLKKECEGVELIDMVTID